MSINILQSRPKPTTVGAISLLIATAAMLVSTISSEPDPKVTRSSADTKKRVTNVLRNGGEDASDSPDGSPKAEDPLDQLRGMIKAIEKLPPIEKLPQPMDIPTARDKAGKGDIEGANFLIEYFDRRQDEILNPKDGSEHPAIDTIDDTILDELGISKDELTLFRNGSELPFHLDLLENKDGKLTELANQLNDEGVGYVGGGDHESILSNLRPLFIMKLLCSQEGYGPGGANEQLFLKLIGRSRQQLQDIALNTHATVSQYPNLDEWDIQCLSYIEGTYFPKEEFDLEIE